MQQKEYHFQFVQNSGICQQHYFDSHDRTRELQLMIGHWAFEQERVLVNDLVDVVDPPR